MAESARIAVIYYSAAGGVHALASRAAQAAEKAGADVRLRRVAEHAPPEAIASNPGWTAHAAETANLEIATPNDMAWADAILFGSPTRFGNIASQLKQYIDQLGGMWWEGKLADKVYAGFVSASTLHGGHESTLLALYNSVHHFGGILVPPGYTDPSKLIDGNPYGVSQVGNNNHVPPDDIAFTAIDHPVSRVLRFARLLTPAAA
jgi:NAD(P)H dehydrogenase (quinone)